MAKKKNTEIDNEAFVSVGDKVSLNGNEKTLRDSSLSDEEICTIFDFYVSHAPILKSGDNNKFGLRNLVEYGWRGNSSLSALEKKLLMSSGMHNIVIKRSQTITQTLEKMDLGEEICLSGPRSVIMQDCKITLEESGKIKFDDQETRLVCLFRHIRNSLAHNQIYYFEDADMILLEDSKNTNVTTARILIKTHTLIDWINVVDKEHKYYFNNSPENRDSIDKTA